MSSFIMFILYSCDENLSFFEGISSANTGKGVKTGKNTVPRPLLSQLLPKKTDLYPKVLL